MNNEQIDEWEALNRLANIVSLANFVLNLEEASNTDIMKALDEQDQKYLTEIKKEIQGVKEEQATINSKLDKILEKIND